MYAALVVLGTRVLFLSLAWSASFLLATDTMGLPDHGVFEIWSRSEAGGYLAVAEGGYEGRAALDNPYAFFPLYPLAIALLSVVGVPALAAALVVSALGSWVALAFLYKLAAQEGGRDGSLERARRAVLYLAFFPTAVFLIAPYSDPLLLAGAIPAFYFARRRAWHLVGPFATVATAASLVGAFVLLGLVVEALRQGALKPLRPTAPVVALAVGAIPLAAYMAYLAGVAGDALYFVAGHQPGAAFEPPFGTFTVEGWNDPMGTTASQLAYRIEVVTALLALLVVAWAMKKGEWGYATYMGATLAMLLTGSLYSSAPRAFVAFFPAALFMADRTLTRQRTHEMYLAVASALTGAAVIVYTQGVWSM